MAIEAWPQKAELKHGAFAAPLMSGRFVQEAGSAKSVRALQSIGQVGPKPTLLTDAAKIQIEPKLTDAASRWNGSNASQISRSAHELYILRPAARRRPSSGTK